MAARNLIYGVEELQSDARIELRSSDEVENYLKVKKIVVKIASEDHGRVLDRVGATEIVFPEKDMALRLAQSLISPNILDYLPLSPEYSLLELAPPKEFIGKSLAELRLRSRFGVNVLAVRQIIPERMIINHSVCVGATGGVASLIIWSRGPSIFVCTSISLILRCSVWYVSFARIRFSTRWSSSSMS